MSLFFYFDEAMTDQISSSPQTTLTVDTNVTDTVLNVANTTNFQPGHDIRIGEIKRTVSAVGGSTLTLSSAIGQSFSSGSLITNVSFNNPDLTSGVGNDGYIDEKRIYVGNTEDTKKYENVVVTAANVDAEIDVKYAFDSGGNPGTYQAVLNLPNITRISGTNAVVKVWRKITVAGGTGSQQKVTIKHKVTATEYAVY